MILPPLHGTCLLQDFFVYAACDAEYFDEFAPAFISSIKANDGSHLHLHIFNPRPDQLALCQSQAVSTTWEHVPESLFEPSAQRWSTVPVQEPELSRYQRTLTAMTKGGDSRVVQRMQKTYFACARFIRLAQLCNNGNVLALDIDAVVRRPLVAPTGPNDFFIHHISGRKARYLAGGLWLSASPRCADFLQAYADQLRAWIEQDYVYWGLDQDLLDQLVPKYNHGQLPMALIDWNMNPASTVWTAKGTRKNLAVFVNEQKRYGL